MKLTELYKSETGEKAIYRKDSSDYHTLKYVRWLENRASKQANPANLKTNLGCVHRITRPSRKEVMPT